MPGADIVQWLMKNLSIEDPGKAAETSVGEAPARRGLNGTGTLYLWAFSHADS